MLSVIASVAMLAGVVFAAAGESEDWTKLLITGAPTALLAVLILTDRVATTGERDRLRVEVEQCRKENHEQNDIIRKEIIPPLVRLTDQLPAVVEALHRAAMREP